MRRPALAFPTLMLLLLAGAPSLAEADTAPRQISVTGEASLSADPDMAIFTAGVTSTAPAAADALAANSRATAAVIARLKSEKISPKDIQTSGFSVQPEVVTPDSSGSDAPAAPKITGYTVSNNVTVRLREPARLGTLLDKVVTAGANTIGDVDFQVSNQSALLDDARKAALTDARRKAELYAGAGGGKLGRILSLSEGGALPVAQILGGLKARRAAAPIESGQTELSVQVSVTYEITD